MSTLPAAARNDRLHLLNVGLMLLSLAVSLKLPFQLFLFAYAVLGPAHYLTEISWLHDRGYFTRGRRDYWLLALPAVLVAAIILSPPSVMGNAEAAALSARLVFCGFFAALLFMATASPIARLIGLTFLVLIAAFTTPSVALFSLFVPTLGHVYLATGVFILHGALKERSLAGLGSLVVFLLCPVVIWLWRPGAAPVRDDLAHAYGPAFSSVNLLLLDLIGQAPGSPSLVPKTVFRSEIGMVVMRFIAFAYTYHYLNWFSKTSIIGWHDVPRRRLIGIGLLWLASLGCYFASYEFGIKALLSLSLVHVFLEFPLNHRAILGTLRGLRWSRPAAAASA